MVCICKINVFREVHPPASLPSATSVNWPLVWRMSQQCVAVTAAAVFLSILSCSFPHCHYILACSFYRMSSIIDTTIVSMRCVLCHQTSNWLWGDMYCIVDMPLLVLSLYTWHILSQAHCVRSLVFLSSYLSVHVNDSNFSAVHFRSLWSWRGRRRNTHPTQCRSSSHSKSHDDVMMV